METQLHARDVKLKGNIEGILPKGPYPPCLRMAGRALLAGYHRHVFMIFGYSESISNVGLFHDNENKRKLHSLIPGIIYAHQLIQLHPIHDINIKWSFCFAFFVASCIIPELVSHAFQKWCCFVHPAQIIVCSSVMPRDVRVQDEVHSPHVFTRRQTTPPFTLCRDRWDFSCCLFLFINMAGKCVVASWYSTTFPPFWCTCVIPNVVILTPSASSACMSTSRL